MTNRRRFLQAIAALPGAAALGPLAQAQSPAHDRVALVVGNDAYRDAPLVNSRNDASAMSRLFASAGFSVDSLLDASRERMVEAIRQFGSAARRPEVREVVFFYAGHGLQLDWRNFLVPVDARVEKGQDVEPRCVELAEVIKVLGGAKDKTFVVMVDACRNDPFGGAYRPPQRGLSQFDAPSGSLIAFSTAPGATASDGLGKNSLYTENLLRELSVRTVRFEDALKRVRLAVRLASRGAQVPWETTSLEGDLYLFPDARRKLSEEELEAELEADLSLWNATKTSRNPDDWIAYLRRFPNGRFAEMAQVRLSRLQTGAAAAAPAAPAPVDSRPSQGPVPRISSVQEWEALAKGTLYYDPKGNLRRKS